MYQKVINKLLSISLQNPALMMKLKQSVLAFNNKTITKLIYRHFLKTPVDVEETEPPSMNRMTSSFKIRPCFPVPVTSDSLI